MIVAVVEICESDPSNILFVDVDVLRTKTTKEEKVYLSAIEKALRDSMKVAALTDIECSYSYSCGGISSDVVECSYSYSCGGISSDVFIEPPCHVDDTATLYLESD